MNEDLAGLPTERPLEASADLDAMTALEIVSLMNRLDAAVPQAIAPALPQIAAVAEWAAAAFSAGGRLVYVGAGTSGRLGILDASECPPTFGAPPSQVVGLIAGGEGAVTQSIEGAEDDPEAGAADIDSLSVGPSDVVVGLAASGRTPYVVGALRRARARGAKTGAVACAPGSAIGREAEAAIEVTVGPEVLAGSTRLKAGTAQKLILNMISTAAMTRIGKTWRGRMVDVQTTNAKLRARALRMVTELGETDPETAQRTLDACDGHVKTALCSLLTGVDPQTARARLAAAGGRLREALRAASPLEK